MVLLDFGTGLRRGELSGVRWEEDICFEDKVLTPKRSIVKQRIGKVKTEASKKSIPLDDVLIEELLAWRRETPYAQESDYVFASTKMRGKKRQFFLENAGVFSFPMSSGESADQLFFSRQIGIDPVTGQQVPINGGGKLTGELAGFELGVMDVDTRSSGPNPYANYAVLRVKRSIGSSGSYIGAMGIDKRFGNPAGNFNETGGVDGKAVLFKNLVLNGFMAQTRTPGLTQGQTNLGAGLVYHTNWLDFQADHRKIGPNFNPAVGFLERFRRGLHPELRPQRGSVL